jgi:putative transposase
MAQSLSKLFVHLIFHIKSNSTVIRDSEKTHLYAYIGSVFMIKQKDTLKIRRSIIRKILLEKSISCF